MSESQTFKNYGVGVGLRVAHLADFLDAGRPLESVQWVEAISENYMDGKNLQNTRSILNLEKIRRDYPVALHGVSMSLGSMHELDSNYLKKLKVLADRIDPIAISDHLCWTRIHGIQTHDLNPLPYTESLVIHVSDKIKKAQDYLGRRMFIENVSSYLTFENSKYSEPEFLSRIAELADCGILLDINNTYVSSVNHGFDAHEFLASLPHDRVGQIHLAGHTRQNGLLIDTHDAPVTDEVWNLYQWYGKNFGHPSSMIERDGNIPAWLELEREVLKMKSLFESNENVKRPKFQSVISRSEVAFINHEQDQQKWASSLFAGFEVSGVVDQPPVSGRDRFTICEDAFWIRLNEAVSEDFVRTRNWVIQNQGEDRWNEWVFDALSKVPPHSWTLTEIGEAFLQGLDQMNYSSLYAEAFALAEQDWALIRTHFLAFASSSAKLDFSELQSLSEDELSEVILTLNPSVQILAAQKRVIWTSGKPFEKCFSSDEWKGIVAVLQEVPMIQMSDHQLLIQQCVQNGLVNGWKRKKVSEHENDGSEKKS